MLQRLINFTPHSRLGLGRCTLATKTTPITPTRVNPHPGLVTAQGYKNKAWYLENKKQLEEQYYGKVLGVDREKVVAVAEDYTSLLNKVNEHDTPETVYICWCGFDDYFPTPVVIPFPNNQITTYPPVLQEFVGEIPQHPDEYKPLSQFTPVGIYKRGPIRNKVNPPPFSPFITLGMNTSRSEKVVYPITFLVDTGSPATYLNINTIKALAIDEKPFFTHMGYSLYYKKEHIACSASKDHFEEINVLGTDLLWKGKLEFDFSKQHLKFDIPDI